MEELIKNIILNSEENVGFIGDSEDIETVVYEMMDDGVNFYLTDEEVADMVDENDVLQITKLVCEDCRKVEYHLERVLDDEDYTIYDELDTFYIDSDLIDCIDIEVLNGEIVEVELQIEDDECYRDCENCTLNDEDKEYDDFEDYDEETMGVALADEFLDSLEEIDEDDGEEVYNLIVKYMQMSYQAGKDDSLAELSDAIDAIKSLR